MPVFAVSGPFSTVSTGFAIVGVSVRGFFCRRIKIPDNKAYHDSHNDCQNHPYNRLIKTDQYYRKQYVGVHQKFDFRKHTLVQNKITGSVFISGDKLIQKLQPPGVSGGCYLNLQIIYHGRQVVKTVLDFR